PYHRASPRRDSGHRHARRDPREPGGEGRLPGRSRGLNVLLQVRDLNTYYGASHVLQGISLDVAKGELVALLGRNGMGKSTTLKTVMGLVKSRTGSVHFNGKEITGHAPY